MHDSGLFEIKVCQYVATRRERDQSVASKSLVATRRKTHDVLYFHHLLGHSNEGITGGTSSAAGVRLTETWAPCVQCSEARVR